MDLNRLDDLGQATEVVSTTLDCGVRGGLIEDVSDLSDAELEDEIDDILLRLFDEVVTGGDDTSTAVAAGARLVGVSMTRTMTRDVGGRLSRMRAGGPGELGSTPGPSTYTTDAKSDLQTEIPGDIVVADRWHVWGEIYTFSEDFDAQRGGTGAIIAPEIDFDIFGGTIGIDYRANTNWTIGLGLGAANGEAEYARGGDLDVDSFAIMPYVSYYQQDALGGADFYADLMYGYVDSEYEYSIGDIETDGEAHLVELNAGLNYGSSDFVHGPFVQLRSINGDIDNGSDFESFATQLGYQVSKGIPVGGGTVVPNLALAWEHEFEEDQGSIAGISVGEVDEDLFVESAGVQYLMSSGAHVGLGYQGRFGSETESHYFGLNGGFSF